MFIGMIFKIVLEKKNRFDFFLSTFPYIFFEISHFHTSCDQVFGCPTFYDGPLPTQKKKFFFRVRKKIENFRSITLICSKWITKRITYVKDRDLLHFQNHRNRVYGPKYGTVERTPTLKSGVSYTVSYLRGFYDFVAVESLDLLQMWSVVSTFLQD